MKRGIALPLQNAPALALGGLCCVVVSCIATANLSNSVSAAEKPAATVEQKRTSALEAGASSDSNPSRLAEREIALGFTKAIDRDLDSLVEGSKRAIVETGISESYFDKHFKLIKTVDDPADRRVEWLYSVNGYEAQLVDAIGFHTTGGKRAYVHGIKNQLYATHEIVKTLSLKQARRILKRCIGRYESESVIYRTLTVPGKARLYLTGRSIPERKRERERESERKSKKTESEDEGQFLYVGFVDVETGKCVKKLGRGSS